MIPVFLGIYTVNILVIKWVNLNVRLNQQFFSLCQNFLFMVVFLCLVIDFNKNKVDNVKIFDVFDTKVFALHIKVRFCYTLNCEEGNTLSAKHNDKMICQNKVFFYSGNRDKLLKTKEKEK